MVAFPLGRIDDLGCAAGYRARDGAEFRGLASAACTDFFVGVRKFDSVIVFQGREQGIASQAG